MLLAPPPSQEPHLGLGHPEPLGRPARAAPAARVEEHLATVVVAAQVQDTVQLTAMQGSDLTQAVVERVGIGV